MVAVAQWFGRFYVAALAAGVMPASAEAQERGWWGQRANPARESRPNDLNERDSAVMYAEARADLDAARFAMAQRRLELLVARYPQSALAEVARRDLQKLYVLAAPGATDSSTRVDAPRVDAPRVVGSRADSPRPTDLRISEPRALAEGYRPAALPQTMPERAGTTASVASPQPASTLTSALRLANEDFRQQAGDRVFFADGSSDLGGRARFALEAQAAWLLRHGDVKVMIEGHADDQGSRDFNRQLAERRAEVVRQRLADLGVPEDRIQSTSHGRSEPLADCPEQACKIQNRRVVTGIVHVPASLGFDAPARRKLGNAASVVGQPSRAP